MEEMDDYGFIITRHVNSEKTNKYWNQNVKLIRRFYPNKKIIIIDDNSNQSLIKAHFNYKNLTIVNSEYPKRGELLPYIYFLKNKWFKRAVIIHDSVFIHKKVNFSKINVPVLPLWHFPDFDDNPRNTNRILHNLKNKGTLIRTLNGNGNLNVLGMSKKNWYGCFGCQSVINHDFLVNIQNKYNITNLLRCVNCRKDRCSLERVFGIIFDTEFPLLKQIHSLFGNIQSYQRWGYNFDNYYRDFLKKRVPKPWVKTWTGR